MQFIPALLVFVPIIAALIIYISKNKKISRIVFVAQTIQTVLIVLYILHLQTNPENALLVFGGWDERIGISFYNDLTSLSFIVLTIFMWWVVLLFTYNTNRREAKFLFFLMFLQGIFLGLIQTNDLFNMFVFLELITVLVTILIAYKKTGPSFRAGIYYLLLNTIGALVFLVGVILVYYVFGTINIQYIREHIHLHSDTATVRLAYIFMVSGISIKAALFPVFTWLPRAHGVAQSTISALLSGLIVKGALYMFIRINNQMFALANYGTNDLFFYIGLVTALVGVIFAISQKEMKQILAYHTISQVGIMMMGLSSASDYVAFGGFLHIFNHAFFKSLLFLGTGVIIKVYQSKKVSEVRGVMKTMPIISVLMIIGMLSISGAPMFNGFVSKYVVKYGYQDESLKLFLITLVNIGTATSFLKFSQIFFGPKKDFKLSRNFKQHLSISLLAIACVVGGLMYVPIAKHIYDIDLSKIQWLMFSNFVDYGIYIVVGLLFYELIISKDFWPFRAIREIKISFENANYLFVIYLIVIAVVVIGWPFI